jgi:hypothetical protein
MAAGSSAAGELRATILGMAEDVERKFLAAWEIFARTVDDARAPEATYQAWFAHYLISQFGIDRVAREPIFKHLRAGSAWQDRVPGGEVKLDAVITREPGVDLPHYVHRGGDGTGMHTLGDLAVICELKVATSAGDGLDHREVAQDVYKLSLLLEQADARGVQAPVAFACILDNNAARRYRRAGLDKRLEQLAPDSRVRVLYHPEDHPEAVGS